jgi:hypothetical protein
MHVAAQKRPSDHGHMALEIIKRSVSHSLLEAKTDLVPSQGITRADMRCGSNWRLLVCLNLT